MIERSVYCVIVTFNGMKWIERCLKAIQNSDVPIKVILIDNGSTDGTKHFVVNNFPLVEFIESQENLGFGKANNVGIKRALENGAEHVLLLNQDAYLFEGTLSSSVKILNENSQIGVVSPIHLAKDGGELDFGFYNYINPSKTPHLAADIFNKRGLKQYYHTEFVNAAAWLVRAQVFRDVGGFHPIFDHYGEDDEFILRIKRHSFSMCIDPHFSVIHDRPQNRSNNIFFKRYLRLERNILLNFMRRKEVTSLDVFKDYFKLLLTALFRLEFREAQLTFKSLLKTLRSISTLKKNSGVNLTV